MLEELPAGSTCHLHFACNGALYSLFRKNDTLSLIGPVSLEIVVDGQLPSEEAITPPSRPA
jgi:hypothetical protein